MGLEELRIVHAYLLDYLKTHALTEEEFHCIRRVLRTVSRAERDILVETGVLTRTRIVITKYSDGTTEMEEHKF